MPYQQIKRPFTLDSCGMSKQELINYANWFHSVIDERISQLESAVRETPGFQSWRATFDPESLTKLGEWFAGAVSMRLRTPKEMAELASRGDSRIAVPEQEITDYSISLATDIGMYFARTMERAHPTVAWKQLFGDKRFIDYGRPVLVGFGPAPLNPVHIAITLAYALASKEQSGERLRSIFDYWSKMAS